DGGSDADLILATASRSVAVTSALAALLNPIWLSLICTKRSPPASMPCRIIALRAACSSDIPFRTPLVIVHTAPVPTHAMHFRNPRRSHSTWSCFFVIASASLRARELHVLHTGCLSLVSSSTDWKEEPYIPNDTSPLQRKECSFAVSSLTGHRRFRILIDAADHHGMN